ncbi:hypothetical protein [Dysosmobacter sp.]|uniref:hypothetical protein n=1 Tax=Dysosmobacter sp. TaxID=2591382 RepID=UPI002DB9F970|nr:hypothetical protein [Dysosmobacter sp.]
MEFCGLAQNTYNGWDTGALKSYRKYVDKISAFYNVSADWILTGVDTEKLVLDEAKRKLSLMVCENPSMPSGDRLDFLFDETDYDPMIVAYNLDIDQAYIDSWLQRGILPPRPIVDKVLGVFQIKASELLNSGELEAYLEENEEWGRSPIDSRSKKAPTPVSESGQHVNVVKIAGRDGSFMEKRLTDEQIKALQTIIEQMPDADDL